MKLYFTEPEDKFFGTKFGTMIRAIEARVIDVETGNTLFTKRFDDVADANAFAEMHVDDETRVKFRLI